MGATERRRAVTTREENRTHRRDRRGRGLRGSLIPRRHPAARSRSERFDALVLDEIDHLARHWPDRLADIEFAVEDVPPALPEFDTDVIEDGRVPLCRLIRGRGPGSVAGEPGGDEKARRGRFAAASRLGARAWPPAAADRAQPPRIVLYRRPLEARARNRDDLGDLIFDILVEQVASLLGIDPDEIDPGSS